MNSACVFASQKNNFFITVQSEVVSINIIHIHVNFDR